MLKTLLIGAAILVPCAAQAVTYHYQFEYATANVHVSPEGGAHASGPPYVYDIRSAPGGFYMASELGFDHDGPLTGMFTVQEIRNLDEGWAIGYDLNLVGGFVEFKYGKVTNWYLHTRNNAGSTEIVHFSDRERLSDTSREHFGLPRSVLPSGYFGVGRFEPDETSFYTKPGRWTCFADGLPCGDGPRVAEVPLPASLLFLLSGLGTLFGYRSYA